MTLRRALIALLFLTLSLAVACGERPAADPGPNIDLSDPNVGGSAGSYDGPQTPVPTATATREASPRLDATGEALATFPAASPTLALPAALPPPETPPAPEVTAKATPEPLIEPPVEPSPNSSSEPSPEASATPATGTVNEDGEIIHIVQPGETLYRIGLQYGLSWVIIAEYNGIINPDAISAGQELRIPPAPEATAEPTTESRAPADEPAAATGDETNTTADAPLSPVEDTHTVAAGESLFGIARHYGISWEQVAEANGLAALNQIYAGQVLKIPADAPGPTPNFAYQVRPGDTLAAIARQYGLALAELAAANSLTEPHVIYPGQTITIPGR